MRNAWVAIALLPPLASLGGCLPPAVAVASYAADGASYAASGKSLSDHGISLAKSNDCATWHFIVGRAVCEDPKHPVPTAPLEEHRRDGSVRRAGGAPPESLPEAPAATVGSYLAIGSFADRANAERLAQRYSAYHPRIVGATVGGRDLARVVLGPLDATQLASLRTAGVEGFLVTAPGAAETAGPTG